MCCKEILRTLFVVHIFCVCERCFDWICEASLLDNSEHNVGWFVSVFRLNPPTGRTSSLPVTQARVSDQDFD